MDVEIKKAPATGEEQGLIQRNKSTVLINNHNLLEKDYNKNINSKKLSKRETLESVRVDPYKPLSKPPSILTIDDISFGTLGNFSCLTGKSKSRKTFFLSILIASALDNKGLFQRIKSEIPNTPVLHFDTEQSEYQTQIVAHRNISLLRLTETEKINYKCYCFRGLSDKEMIELIEEAIYNTPNLKLVVIDGIADLTVGYNNEEAAMKIVGKFMKWTQDLNIHIITVVHQNKENPNAKGHLGSFIYQKAETVLSVEKEDTISTVKTTHSRGIEINPLSFSIDDDGLPFFVDYTSKSTSSNRKRKLPRDFEKEVHFTILNELFKKHSELTANDLSRFLKDVLDKHDITIGDTAIRAWKTFYEASDWIIRENQNKPFKLSTLVSQ